MKKFFLSTVALFFAISVYAAPASRESVEKLFTVMQLQANIDNSMSMAAKQAAVGITGAMIAEMERQGVVLTPEAVTKIEAFREELSKQISLSMRSELEPKLKKEYIAAYSHFLQQDEVDFLISYHSTPIGRSVTPKMYQIEMRVALETLKYVQSEEFSDKILKNILSKIMPELMETLETVLE